MHSVNQSESLHYVMYWPEVGVLPGTDKDQQAIKLGLEEVETELKVTFVSAQLACETHETHNTFELSGEFKRGAEVPNNDILLLSLNRAKTLFQYIFPPPVLCREAGGGRTHWKSVGEKS